MLGLAPARGWRVAIAASLALAALAAPVQAANGLPAGFREVAEGSFREGASDLHGDRLVWASFSPQGDVELRLTNLTTRETTALTVIAGSARGLAIPVLDYDGRWVAWLDDRFGNLEAFALDTSGTTLRRLTTTPEDEGTILVSQGRVAWSQGGRMWLEDLASRDRTPLNGPGEIGSPSCIEGDLLVWASLNGTASDLKVRELAGGGERTLLHVDDQGQGGGYCQAGLVAWESIQHYDSKTGRSMDLRRIRWTAIAGGPIHDVQDLDQRHGRLRGFAPGRVAWTDASPTGPITAFHDLDTGRTTDLGDSVRFAGLSEHGIAVAREGPAGHWTIFAMTWGDEGGPRGLPGFGATQSIALVAVVAIFLAGRRLFR